MFGNYKEEIVHRKAIISLLIKMTAADGQVKEVEEKLTSDVARQLGLSTEDIEEVTTYPEKYEMKPPPPEQDRMSILYYLLFTMAVDGQIQEDEERMCYKTGLRLGFNEHMTRDLINVMKKFLNKEIPQDALLNEIKKHMN
ncbi:MAG: putative tellurite resistance protein B-like protein [Saprospiraceae bacterium]|jgi:uncharacterized tellurite resistance protein B-like protein